MTITALPTPPSRTDIANFRTRADAFHAALPTFATEVNADGAVLNANTATVAANTVTVAADKAIVAADKATVAADKATVAADKATVAADKTAAAASAASAAAIAGAFVGTSVTSLLIATGAKTFTTQTGEQYTAGVFLSAVSAANNANFMMGQVTSYNTSTGTLVLDVQVVGGSGTLADWNISLVGARGATGATGATGSVALTGVATGTIDLLTGAAIASAATVNLNAATDGNRHHITGTTTITAWTLTRGPRTVIFDGAVPLTYHATTNRLNSGATNYTTSAGDSAVIESDGTTVFVNITKVAGTAIVGGGASVIRSARTANTILAAADNSTLIDITSGTFTQTFTAAATLASGWFCYLRNSGTGDITLDPNAAELIDGLASYIMYPGETRLVQCTGAAFTSVVLSPFSATFLASGTFTKPPGYAFFDVDINGAGGGGGGGETAAAATAKGGCGGGGGAARQMTMPSTYIATSEAITCGAGGAAVAAVVNGNNGGNTVAFGITMYGGGGGVAASSTSAGGGGGGGWLAAAVGTLNAVGTLIATAVNTNVDGWSTTISLTSSIYGGAQGGIGGNGVVGAKSEAPSRFGGGGGGGGGGGDVAAFGAGGVGAGPNHVTGVAGASVEASAGSTDTKLRFGGSGGAGRTTAGTAGAGGTGGPGAGGGGGGAAYNGTGGAGGAGGAGFVVITGVA